MVIHTQYTAACFIYNCMTTLANSLNYIIYFINDLISFWTTCQHHVFRYPASLHLQALIIINSLHTGCPDQVFLGPDPDPSPVLLIISPYRVWFCIYIYINVDLICKWHTEVTAVNLTCLFSYKLLDPNTEIPIRICSSWSPKMIDDMDESLTGRMRHEEIH